MKPSLGKWTVNKVQVAQQSPAEPPRPGSKKRPSCLILGTAAGCRLTGRNGWRERPPLGFDVYFKKLEVRFCCALAAFHRR